MKREILVSIIIPVYNVEKYLEECLENAVKQTFNAIEIIAVNDGSTDSSLKILERYAQKYDNIQIINQQNQGLSRARNIGLKHVKGKYVYFLDSDDYIDLNMIEECFELAENKNLDIINFDAQVFYESGFESDFNPDYNRSDILESAIYTGEDFYQYIISKNAYKAPVWLSFYKVEYLKKFNLTFYEGITHEDELFSAQAFLLANRVMYYPKSYFNRRVRKESIMTQGKSLKNIDGYMTVANELSKLVSKVKNDETKHILKKEIRRFYGNSIGLTYYVIKDKKELINKVKEIRKSLLSNCSIQDIDKKVLLKLFFPLVSLMYMKNRGCKKN